MFLLGHWKNYDDLESSLCYEELLVTLNASREKERRDRIFFAALQGVDLEAEEPDPVNNDIVKLKGYQAQQEGFGIGMGLGYMEIDS